MEYKNGSTASIFQGKFVLITPEIIADTSTEALKKVVVDDKVLDGFWPLKHFAGYDMLQFMKDNLISRMLVKEKEKNIQLFLDDYPHVPVKLIEEIRNHDYYYSQSDDIRSYRAGKAQAESITTQLKELGVEEFYGKFIKLLYPK
jgi:hypothetical protein